MLIEFLLKFKFINKFIQLISTIFVFHGKDRRKRRRYIEEYCGRKRILRIEKKYNDYWIFPLFSPWGDFTICCALMKEFKAKYGGKILVLVEDKNRANVAKLFPSIDKVIIEKKGDRQFINCHPHTKLKKGMYYELNHWLFIDAPKHNSLNFLELYARMLELENDNITLEPPIINDLIINNVKKEIKKNKLNVENLVIIAPLANSFNCKLIKKTFWLKVANILTSRGYSVIFNSNKKNYKNYPVIFLPMAEQLYLCTLCKKVIALRAGFNDILGIMKNDNLTVIYPQSLFFNTINKFVQQHEFKRAFKDDTSKSFFENMFRITSLKMFKLKNLNEFIFEKDKDFINKMLFDLPIINKKETY